MAGASIQFSTKLNDKRMRADFKRLKTVDQFQAAAEALNKVRAGIKTDVKKPIASMVPIRQAPVLKRTTRRLLLPKGGRATWRNPVAISLQLYKYVPKIWLYDSVASAKASLGGNEFVQVMKNGYVGVFKRKGRGGGKGKITQVVIDESEVTTRQVERAIIKAGSTRWPVEFNRSAKRYIAKRL